MRIIGGRLKRKRLHSPKEATTTRPLPDHVRESIFNLLRGHFEGVSVLDGFAGTGSFGLEAISRGAARVTFVERERRVATILERNIAELGVGAESELVIGDALGPACLARCGRPLHIALLDPPYDLVRQPEGWARVVTQMSRVVALLDETGFAMVRTPWPFVHEPPSPPSGAAVHDPDDDGEVIEVDLASDDEGLIDAFEASLASARVVPADVDLSIPGAIGPETHAYGSTAVHLYMRDRSSGG